MEPDASFDGPGPEEASLEGAPLEDVFVEDARKLPCNGGTCPGGCCTASGACVSGATDTECGTSGTACANCESAGTFCTHQACAEAEASGCGPDTCDGCCDSSGTCEAGFLDVACGQGGGACLDCANLGSTCDGAVSPRVCASQQAMCPTSYLGCDPALQTTPMGLSQGVCTQTDLSNAAEACSGGAHTSACKSFFSFEQAQEPQCYSCLSAFDWDYSELEGIFACAAPFEDAVCNHEAACVADCANASCSECSDPATALECKANALQSGACTAYVGMVTGCVGVIVTSEAPFCAPAPGEAFGQWLETVGNPFCGE